MMKIIPGSEKRGTSSSCNLYALCGSLGYMRYGHSQLGCSFPYCAVRTTYFKTTSPSYIPLGLTFELYLLVSICLAENSGRGQLPLLRRLGMVLTLSLSCSPPHWIGIAFTWAFQSSHAACHLLCIQKKIGLTWWWNVGWCGTTIVSRAAVLPITIWHRQTSSWIL